VKEAIHSIVRRAELIGSTDDDLIKNLKSE
jgi:hypothetical protein